MIVLSSIKLFWKGIVIVNGLNFVKVFNWSCWCQKIDGHSQRLQCLQRGPAKQVRQLEVFRPFDNQVGISREKYDRITEEQEIVGKWRFTPMMLSNQGHICDVDVELCRSDIHPVDQHPRADQTALT